LIFQNIKGINKKIIILICLDFSFIDEL